MVKKRLLEDVLLTWNSDNSGPSNTTVDILNTDLIKSQISTWNILLKYNDENIKISGFNPDDIPDAPSIYFKMNTDSLDIYIVLEAVPKDNYSSYIYWVKCKCNDIWQGMTPEDQTEVYNIVVGTDENDIKDYKYIKVFIIECSEGNKSLSALTVIDNAVLGSFEYRKAAIGYSSWNPMGNFINSLISMCNLEDSESWPRTSNSSYWDKWAESGYYKNQDTKKIIFRYNSIIRTYYYERQLAKNANFYVSENITKCEINHIEKLIPEYIKKEDNATIHEQSIQVYKQAHISTGSHKNYYRQHFSPLELVITGIINNPTKLEVDNSISVLNLQGLTVFSGGTFRLPEFVVDSQQTNSLASRVLLLGKDADRILLVINLRDYLNAYKNNNQWFKISSSWKVRGNGNVGPIIVIDFMHVNDILNNASYDLDTLLKNIFKYIFKDFHYNLSNEIKVALKGISGGSLEILENYLDEPLDILIAKSLNFKETQKVDIVEP